MRHTHRLLVGQSGLEWVTVWNAGTADGSLIHYITGLTANFIHEETEVWRQVKCIAQVPKQINAEFPVNHFSLLVWG